MKAMTVLIETLAKSCLTVFIFTTVIVSAHQASAEGIQPNRAATEAAFKNQPEVLAQLAAQAEGYDKAYALYRLAGLTISNGNRAEVAPLLNDALVALEDLSDAEANVLKAANKGMLLGLSFKDADKISVEIHHLLMAAKQNADARPRALLVQGIQLFYTPPAFGGGVEKAIALFESATEAFAQQAPSNPVQWGEADAWVWLGQAKLKAGLVEEAKAAFEQALAVDPTCEWALNLLSALPSSS